MKNLEQIPSNESLEIKEKKQADRMPLEYRNPFQIEVFRILIADKIFNETDMNAIGKYSKIISDFIDNPDNIQVRELILQKKFKEAAEIMVDEIHREESLPKAA